VLLKALQEHHIVQTERGRIAVGWLIVEDLAMVLALVLLPVLAQATGSGAIASAPGFGADTWTLLLTTVFKVVAFVAFMLLIGRKVIPFVLHYVAHTGSKELFRLAVLAIALGVAFGAASLFGVSFALGAFFAGMILSESELSHQAAEETLPLRDAFAVLFFVAAGMLFNPMVVIDQPLGLLATLAVILLGKSLAAFLIMRAFGHPNSSAIVVSASLAQIGEFSFILATLGLDLAILPASGRDLIVAGAIISIILNPLIFHLAMRAAKKAGKKEAVADPARPETDIKPTALTGHAIVIGYGRVGEALVSDLKTNALPVLIIDDRPERVEIARALGIETMLGNAAEWDVLAATNIAQARQLFVAIPNVFEAGQVVEQARRANPALRIIARAHSSEEVEHLRSHGADEAVMGEHELARGMLARAEKMVSSP
jgi:CPA2 family monovalent cation:H+ antiporter-2